MRQILAVFAILVIGFSAIIIAGAQNGGFSTPNTRGSTILREPRIIASHASVQKLALPPVLLSKTWSNANLTAAADLANDSLGNIYLTGFSLSTFVGPSLAEQAFLLKYNSTGSLIWQRGWNASNGAAGRGVAVDSSGNVYVTGITSTNASARLLVLRFDSAGNLLWQKIFGEGLGSQLGADINLDPEGNLYISGLISYYGTGQSNLLLLKLNSTGDLLWQRSWGGTRMDSGVNNAVDQSGNVYITGYTSSFGTGTANVVLLKINSTGNLVWQRIASTSSFAEGADVSIDTSGSVYVTGSIINSGINQSASNVFLLKFDSTGNLMWQRTYGTPGPYAILQIGSGVTTDLSGTVYVTGYTNGFGTGGSDILILKFNSTGSLLSQIAVGSRGPDLSTGHPLIDSSGDLLTTGGVGQAPPYLVCPGDESLLTSSFTVSNTGNNTLGNPSQPLNSASENMFTPTGSQTFTGLLDSFLVEVGSTTTLPSPATSCVPTRLTATVNSTGVLLTWNPPTYNGGSPITGYKVYRAGSGQSNATFLASLGNQTYYVDSSVQANSLYSYMVTAVNSIGESGFSITAYASVPSTPPSAPINLNATGGSGQITLHWTTPADSGGTPITGYKVYRGTAPGSETLLTSLPVVNSYVDTSVTSGVKYYYYVTALNSIGESPHSNEASSSQGVPVFPIAGGEIIIATAIITAAVLTRSTRRLRRPI